MITLVYLPSQVTFSVSSLRQDSTKRVRASVFLKRFFMPPYNSQRSDLPNWCILHRNKVSSLRLTELDSLPPVPYGCSVVTIGQEMYVIGGIVDRRRLPMMTLIDCRTHKCRSLPKMKRGCYNAAAGVIDGKIYVIGG